MSDALTKNRKNKDMRKLITSLLIFTAVQLSAQIPQLINYQGKAHSPNGATFTGNVSLRFEILQGSSSGTAIFTEDHLNLAVSSEGLFSTQIGKNNALPTTWNQGPYFLRVSIDTTALSNFVALPNPQQLASVPFALNVPSPALTLTNNILTVGTNTVQLPAQGGLQTLSVSGNSLSITGGNTITLPAPSVTGSGGGVTVTTNGNTTNVHTPSVSLIRALEVLGTDTDGGLLQITGSYPNYKLAVSPQLSYNQSDGRLYIGSYPFSTPAYNYSYYVTPDLNFSNGIIWSGPNSNSQNMNGYMPWRTQLVAPTTVTLGNNTSSVGIGTNAPTANFQVDGYTKLGAGANSVAMQVVKVVTVTPNAVNSTINVALPNVTYQGANQGQLTSNKIIGITMMADPSVGPDWVGPANTSTGNEFHWQVTGSNIVVSTTLANSANVLNVPLRILITFEP